MSVSIDTITVSSIEDRRLCLANSQAARVMTIGTSWSRLRIGVRLAVDDTGANIAGNPLLYIGVLSNPSANLANGPLTSSTSHFVGILPNIGTWVRSGGPPAFYQYISAGTGVATFPVKRIGSTNTRPTSTQSNRWLGTTTSDRRDLIVVEITKGSPNFTFNTISNTVNGAHNDVTKAMMTTAMETAGTPTDLATALTALVGQNYGNISIANLLPVDEATNGFLNAICVAWDKSVPVMRISDVMFAKMA